MAIPTEDSVQNDICLLHALLQLLYTLENRYLEVLALLQEALVDILRAWLREIDRWLVAEMMQMTRSYETIATLLSL